MRSFFKEPKRPTRSLPAAGLAALWILAACPACSGDAAAKEPTCLDEPANAGCTNALYGLHDGGIAPTFEELFTNTLAPTCGARGCHGGDHPQAGLPLDDIDAAYQGLLATNSAGERRVIPKDVRCGKVIVRLESVGESWSMPPDNHLPEETLCAIRHWIANGAKR